MVFFHLTGEFEQHLPGQLDPVVVVLLELNELHQISDGLVSILISHLHVIVIKLVHDVPVVPVSDADHDDAQRQLSALNQEIFNFFLILDDPVS